MRNSAGISVLGVALLLSLAACQQDQGTLRAARGSSPQTTDTTGSGARPKAGTAEASTKGRQQKEVERRAWHGPSIQKSGEYRAHLDCSEQVLGIDVSVGDGWSGESGEAELLPTFPAAKGSMIVSASQLAQKAKIFDDGLYAAVDLAAQQGVGSLMGKKALLRRLLARLAPHAGASAGPRARLEASARLGGQRLALVPAEQKVVDRMEKRFLAMDVLSKPIGFYTWSEKLTWIFRQDRMLQQNLRSEGPKPAGAGGDRELRTIIRALHGDADLRRSYDAQLDLAAHLTNPQRDAGLRPYLEALDRDAADPLGLPDPKSPIAFYPASVSHESNLLRNLFPTGEVPPGFQLMQALIDGVVDGTLSLDPRKDSGWYDYQTWALEPLLLPERMPEAPALRLTPAYRTQLRELFKGNLALTRETHAKQLEVLGDTTMAMPTHQPLWLQPRLRVEPLATHYLRRAESYRYVHRILEKTFGRASLAKMHRQTPRGPVTMDLARELSWMESLFHGAWRTACEDLDRDLPSPDGLASQRAADARIFRDWALAIDRDPDLGLDSRMMVPVFHDGKRGMTKVWLFLGWTRKQLKVSYAHAPRLVHAFDAQGKKRTPAQLDIRWAGSSYWFYYPVMAEAYTKRILDRAEFRRLCDECRTRSKIFAKLRLSPLSKKTSHLDIPTPAAERIVELKKGQTIFRLAQQHLGSASRWREILQFNNLTEASARKLPPGTMLRLPR